MFSQPFYDTGEQHVPRFEFLKGSNGRLLAGIAMPAHTGFDVTTASLLPQSFGHICVGAAGETKHMVGLLQQLPTFLATSGHCLGKWGSRIQLMSLAPQGKGLNSDAGNVPSRSSSTDMTDSFGSCKTPMFCCAGLIANDSLLAILSSS